MLDCNIGFIGLGAIGYPMAAAVRRGLDKEFSVSVYDVYRPSCERFQAHFGEAGLVEIADSPRTVATKCDIVVSMVPGPAEVKQVFLDGTNGIISAPKNPARLLLECSTIDTQTARFVAGLIDQADGGVYIDAPVSGGVPAAEKQTLSFIVGHAAPKAGVALDVRLKSIIATMADPQKVYWCGGIGLGLAAKISNNYISCSVLLLVAEAMAIGVEAGVDAKLLHEIIRNSTGQTFMGDNVCPVPDVVPHAPSSNGWRLGFKTQMFLKDLSLGINSARHFGLSPSMAEAAYNVFVRASKDPQCVDRDGSSVYLHITNNRSSA